MHLAQNENFVPGTLSSLQKLHKDLTEVMRLFATGHGREICNRCNTKLCGQGWGWGLKK
jgi:hypothetical protein